MKTLLLIACILLSSCSAKTLTIKDRQQKELKKVERKEKHKERKKELNIIVVVAIIGFIGGYLIGNNYK